MLPTLTGRSVADRLLCAGFLLLFAGMAAYGQKPVEMKHDSSFYKTYPHQITGRLYLSKKYTTLALEGPEGVKALRYRPHTPLTMGVGATYGIVSVNVGFPIPFLSPDSRETGKSKYLDLQSHIYATKWVIDLYGQFYKGYHAVPRGYGSMDPSAFYVRPDIRVNILGASVYRLFNGEQFSYRAAFLQNEWQKKSAGSLLVGVEAYTGVAKGDSALVPNHLDSVFKQHDITRVRFTEFGPGVGYAYTYVYEKNYFLTGSLTATGDVSFVSEFKGKAVERRTTISPNLTVRIVAGYNSDNWMVNLAWINSSTNLAGKSSNDQYLIKIGSFRLALAKRIKPGKKLKKQLKIIDDLPVPQL
ncbi:MAG: DUF4421 domain-containing protein [Chitinophagaceae bacterium]|nr:MAG: DUF4421 domain-containing protein [Chitinophagaceae bacterium]